jgi:hypothetical protein
MSYENSLNMNSPFCFLNCALIKRSHIMKRLILFLFFVFNFTMFYSQTFLQPNYGLKSHETLVLNKVELTSAFARFYLTIENRIINGYFCADRNIYLIYPDGSRIKLLSSENIPVCPETHKFKSPGEKLDFTLTFPPLKPGTEWVDLVEDCLDNCFSFYGVTLDNNLNVEINEAFRLAETDETAKAMIKFIDIADAIDGKNAGIEGILYVNIINLAKRSDDIARASQWYSRMKSSGAPRLKEYIKYLNDMGIKY